MLCDNFGKEVNPGTKQRKLSNNVLIHGTNYGKKAGPGTKQQQMTNNVVIQGTNFPEMSGQLL